MNTLHFEYAVEVERTGSITKAAQNLYMAQPNLSKALKDLEDTLGYQIFERTPQGVVITEKGKKFIDCAKSILYKLKELEDTEQRTHEQFQEFKISIPRGSYIVNGFTEFVAELDEKKKIDITVKETSSIQTIADVAEGHHNLGIIRYQTLYENYFLDYLLRKDLEYDAIWEFEYVLVMSKKHPLSTKEKILKEDLQNYIEILHCDTEIPFIRESSETEQTAENAKKRIYVYERGSQFDLLTNVETTYMWVSPIPESYLEQYGLVQRVCSVNSNSYKDLLIYSKGYEFTKLDMQFQKKLYESKIEVSSKRYY